MNKIFLISLLIGSTILIEPFREDSPCVQLQPENPEDCFKSDPEFFRQTCCYFEGNYSVDGTYKVGKACLEANRSDVSTGERKFETQKKIEAGTYWEDYPPITNIESFLCYDTISDCEKRQPAANENECFAAKPELLNEGCCYIESDWVKGDKHEKDVIGACVDVGLEDSLTEQKIEETKKKIIDGTYWGEEYGHATKINKLVCANTQKSAGHSNFVSLDLLALFLVFSLF